MQYIRLIIAVITSFTIVVQFIPTATAQTLGPEDLPGPGEELSVYSSAELVIEPGQTANLGGTIFVGGADGELKIKNAGVVNVQGTDAKISAGYGGQIDLENVFGTFVGQQLNFKAGGMEHGEKSTINITNGPQCVDKVNIQNDSFGNINWQEQGELPKNLHVTNTGWGTFNFTLSGSALHTNLEVNTYRAHTNLALSGSGDFSSISLKDQNDDTNLFISGDIRADVFNLLANGALGLHNVTNTGVLDIDQFIIDSNYGGQINHDNMFGTIITGESLIDASGWSHGQASSIDIFNGEAWVSGEAVIQRQTLLPGDQPAAELQFERDSEGTFVNLDNRNGLFRTLQIITWTGAGDTNNWSEAADWDNAPTGVPFDLGGNRLVFDGATRLSPFADDGHGGAGNYINIGGITFAENADPFTLRGGTLTFGKFNRGIINHSTNRQTIENDLIAPEHGLGAEWQLAVEATDGPLTLTGSVDLQDDGYLLVTGGSNTRIAGPISGDGGLRKIGCGQLTLAGNNSYQGDTSIREGTLVAAGGNAIPDSGNVNIGSALYETRLVLGNNETIGALDGGGHGWTPGGLSVIDLQDHVLTITGSSQDGFSGRIIGAGSLVKTGTGTQTLAGTNTYGGTTTVKQGTLAVKGGEAIPDDSGKVIIENHPTATFQVCSNETIFSLSGGGTQGGKVRIGDNTLTIGDGSGRADAIFAGAIEGNTGSLALELGEGGRHRFEGDLKFNGGINLISGTVVFDTGTPVPGPVWNAGELFANNGATGQVINTTGGSFMLATGGTIDGPVFNSNNALFVNSGTVDGDFLNTGWLVGSGTFNGMLKNQKGGTLVPGESIGTTVVNGAYVQQAGSILDVEVDGSGDDTPARADHLDVNADNCEDGSATFEKDSIIAISLVEGGGEVRHDDIFDIVDAEGGINAPAGGLEHIQIVEDFQLIDFTLQVAEAGDVLQLLAELMDFVELADRFGADADQRAVAGALNSLAKENQDAPLLRAMRDTTDDGSRFLWALDEAGPQAYEMLPMITVENARLFNTALERYFTGRRAAAPSRGLGGKLPLQQAPMLASRKTEPDMLASAVKQTRDSSNPPPPSQFESTSEQLAVVDKKAWNVFGRAIGIFQDQDNDDGRSGYQADAGGLILGIDRRIMPELGGGLGIAYIRSNTELADDRGHHDIDTVRIGPYVCYSPSPWFLDASLSYGYHRFETKRRTPIPSSDVNSDHDGHDITAYARTGYDFEILESGLTITPEASLQYLYLYEEAFTESGPGALDVDSRNTDSLQSRLGLSCKYPVTVSQMLVIPEVFLGWEHEFLADDEDTHAHFVSGGKTFGVDIPDARRDSASINASVTALIKKNISAYLRYDGSYHSHGETHGVSAGFHYNF